MTAQGQFIRKTFLGPDEYQTDFTLTDNGILDSLISEEAQRVTTLMSTIYFRLKRAPTKFWERDGVLRFTGETDSHQPTTAWQQLSELAGVANSTLSKALQWMHKRGLIGYVAHKNGVGIRIFFNRAANSIQRRQKNLRLVPAPAPAPAAPSNGTPFKDASLLEHPDSLSLSAHARESDQSEEQAATEPGPPPPTGHTLQNPQPSFSPSDLLRQVNQQTQQLLGKLKEELAAAIGRENKATREWFLNFGLPKASRVAQRETYDLLRTYGVVSKKTGSAHLVGDNAAASYASQAEIFPAQEVAGYLEEICHAIQSASTQDAVKGNAVLKELCYSSRAELKQLQQQIGTSSDIEFLEVEEKLERIDQSITGGIWDSLCESDKGALLIKARKELQSYAARMDRDEFEKTVKQRVLKSLREQMHLPRVSLVLSL